ncbi:nucleoside recognition domain protein [Alkaliphilus metalliredigens QYMF]|uniref:Nucleoside recognition domain protein n=1 Tax=Alkaliphilus metalliredigens (strain QYMF) TaxID=293826 RepID=A6TJH1_ALKMQ|nr:nucleoside recognition domain-containing protein [Alkaliphilus metalliredigens]ABR46339.1 nucleoside recognition domain protein [Alkaliphilus metalliredigens QYMF]
MEAMAMVSILAIPAMITVILLHGWIKKVPLYDSFVAGGKEGFQTAVRIMPYLVAIFLAIGLMRKSGAMDYLIQLLMPLARLVGIPSEVLPLTLMRPLSGSGSLVILKDIIGTYGADSFPGRVAATMMGSAETIFYTMAVYFGAIGVQRSRHTVPAALIAHFASVIASVVVWSVLLRRL